MATAADRMVEVLIQAGIRRIYGVVGDSLNSVVDAVRRHAQKPGRRAYSTGRLIPAGAPSLPVFRRSLLRLQAPSQATCHMVREGVAWIGLSWPGDGIAARTSRRIAIQRFS